MADKGLEEVPESESHCIRRASIRSGDPAAIIYKRRESKADTFALQAKSSRTTMRSLTPSIP